MALDNITLPGVMLLQWEYQSSERGGDETKRLGSKPRGKIPVHGDNEPTFLDGFRQTPCTI
jgi:hypothetical protein